jgi:hypothetical protein
MFTYLKRDSFPHRFRHFRPCTIFLFGYNTFVFRKRILVEITIYENTETNKTEIAHIRKEGEGVMKYAKCDLHYFSGLSLINNSNIAKKKWLHIQGYSTFKLFRPYI